MSQRVYIAGPMTGFPAHNREAFLAAKQFWEADGYEVVTPFDTNNTVWRREHGVDYDADKDIVGYEHPLIGEMLKEDLRALLDADIVAFLPGWEKSKGARFEYEVARWCRITMFTSDTREKIA